MKYYLIYKITNNINGKTYIGAHKTNDINDGYMGSGTYLNRAIKKYGVENFNKEILHIFDNPEAMYAKEAEIVNEDYLMNENTYNMKVGGFGGWDYVNSNLTKSQLSLRGKKARSFSKGSLGLSKTEEHKLKIKISMTSISDEDVYAAYLINRSYRSTRKYLKLKYGISPSNRRLSKIIESNRMNC